MYDLKDKIKELKNNNSGFHYNFAIYLIERFEVENIQKLLHISKSISKELSYYDECIEDVEKIYSLGWDLEEAFEAAYENTGSYIKALDTVKEQCEWTLSQGAFELYIRLNEL